MTHPGDTVTFSCTYPEGHENDMKSVYKVTSQCICAIIFTYTEYEEKDRYVLHVSSRDKVINMSISNVTVDDGGLYLCGVSKSEPSYVSVFSEMQLQVTGENVVVMKINSVLQYYFMYSWVQKPELLIQKQFVRSIAVLAFTKHFSHTIFSQIQYGSHDTLMTFLDPISRDDWL